MMQDHEATYFFDPRLRSLIEVPDKNTPILTSWIAIRSRDHFLFLKQEQKYGKELHYKNGEVISIPPVNKINHPYEVIRQSILSSLSTTLNEKAVEFGYQSIEDAISFADEPSDQQFQIEGRSFRHWKAQCRRTALNMVEHIYRSQDPLPRRSEIERILPNFQLLPNE